MTVNVQWHDDAQRILHYQFQEPFTVKDLHDAIDRGYEMGTSQPHTINIIYDFTDLKSPPPNLFSALGHIRNRVQPNVSVRYVVGASRMVSVFVDVVGKTVPQLGATMRVQPTLHDAVADIQANTQN